MKLLTYYRLSVFSSILFVLLAIILMFAPSQMLTSWGIELTPSVGVLARRIAAVYTGIAVMIFMARNAEHSTTRIALIYGIITSCLILATLGTYEYYEGHASSGILPGVIIEVALAFAFMYVGCECNSPHMLENKQRNK